MLKKQKAATFSCQRMCALLLAVGITLSWLLPQQASAEIVTTDVQETDSISQPLIKLPGSEQSRTLAIDEDGNRSYVAVDEISLSNSAQADSLASLFSASHTGSLYDQLSVVAKNCYDGIRNAGIDRILSGKQDTIGGNPYHTLEFDVGGITGTIITGSISSGGYFTPDAAGAAVDKQLMSEIASAWLAIGYDYPENLWLRNISYDYNIASVPGYRDRVRVTEVYYGFYLEYGGREKQMLEEMNRSVDQIVSSVTKNGDDRYTKLKAVHNYLAETNVYSRDVSNALSHTPYSALITGDSHDPVCDGYSGALKMLCDKLNIPCVLVISVTNDPGHMWNNVQMDDGKWYNIDLTWNDTGAENNAYFLVGQKTQINGRAFDMEGDHFEASISQMLSNKALTPNVFSYPTKNAESYQYLGYAQFPDNRQGEWYYSDVLKASEAKLFSGDEMGHFNPGKTITRAEFAQVMANMMQVPLSQYSALPFPDVKQTDWYAPAIAWTYSEGIFRGDEMGRFNPNAPITREELCTVFYRLDNQTTTTHGSLFADDQSISSWAYDAVYHCLSAGLINGDNGSFYPKNNTSRAEAAAVFVRYLSAA